MRVAFHTFGCKLNQYETEALASRFSESGFSVETADRDADLYIVNTCTVTVRADHKARSFIRALARKHPESPIVITGCSAELEPESLAALPGSIFMVPQSKKASLLELPRFLREAGEAHQGLRSLFSGRELPAEDRFAFRVTDPRFHTRAYLKVQDGCDRRCAYCRVPLARGPSTSLPMEDAVRQALFFEQRGYREIVVTGVNISAWRTPDGDFAGLVSELLSATSRTRLRLSSIEPEAITEGLATVLADPRVCPHFHIPMQSGSDAILGLMRRAYGAQKVKEGAALLRAAKSEPFIAADLIVGFPGESEQDFAQTRSLVEEVRFAALHVFPFSPRPGTPAASLKPSIPERTRSERARVLAALSCRLNKDYSHAWRGKVVEVIFEGTDGERRGPPRGVSGNYLKLEVRGLPDGADPRGKMARVRIAGDGGRSTADFLDFC
jgi:threonylcarbamoyladenosine tRNA methylthiotransferase MtaB